MAFTSLQSCYYSAFFLSFWKGRYRPQCWTTRSRLWSLGSTIPCGLRDVCVRFRDFLRLVMFVTASQCAFLPSRSLWIFSTSCKPGWMCVSSMNYRVSPHGVAYVNSHGTNWARCMSKANSKVPSMRVWVPNVSLATPLEAWIIYCHRDLARRTTSCSQLGCQVFSDLSRGLTLTYSMSSKVWLHGGGSWCPTPRNFDMFWIPWLALSALWKNFLMVCAAPVLREWPRRNAPVSWRLWLSFCDGRIWCRLSWWSWDIQSLVTLLSLEFSAPFGVKIHLRCQNGWALLLCRKSTSSFREDHLVISEKFMKSPARRLKRASAAHSFLNLKSMTCLVKGSGGPSSDSWWLSLTGSNVA